MATSDNKATTPRVSKLLERYLGQVKDAALSGLPKAFEYACPARLSILRSEVSDANDIVIVTVLSPDGKSVRSYTDADNVTSDVVFAFRVGATGVTGLDDESAYTGGMKPVDGFWAYEQSVAGADFLQKAAVELKAGKTFMLSEVLDAINGLPVSCRGEVTATFLSWVDKVKGVCSLSEDANLTEYLPKTK